MISARVWAELGLAPISELYGGYQSTVFLAAGATGQVVVKLIEAAPDELVAVRAAVVTELADHNPAVVGPLGPPVTVDGWQAVRYPYISGTKPDIGDRQQVKEMAVTLAGLHQSMAGLGQIALPPVTALGRTSDTRFGQSQLIHGDFAAANLIATPAGLKVIDFDDCGQGAITFDIGNALYMVRFDSWNSGQLHRYQQFRTWFVDAYRATAGIPLSDELLDAAMRIRVQTLKRWLSSTDEAPPGIRDAPTQWRRKLRSFVATMESQL